MCHLSSLADISTVTMRESVVSFIVSGNHLSPSPKLRAQTKLPKLNLLTVFQQTQRIINGAEDRYLGGNECGIPEATGMEILCHPVVSYGS